LRNTPGYVRVAALERPHMALTGLHDLAALGVCSVCCGSVGL
jgi:hypothetical protein